MPGMKQLKKFSDDITQLGKELIRRQEKGETFPRVDFPAGISDADDSDDFVFGLPISNQHPSGGSSGGGESSSSSGADAGDDSSSVADILAGASGGSDSGEEEQEFDIEALLAEARGETPKQADNASAAPDIDLPGLSGDIVPPADTSAKKTIPEYSAENPFTLPGMDASSGSDAPDIDALLSGFSDDVDTPDINLNEPTGPEPVADDILNNLASADFGTGSDFSESDFAADGDFSADSSDTDFAVQSADEEDDLGNLFSGLDLSEPPVSKAPAADSAPIDFGAAGAEETPDSQTTATSSFDMPDASAEASGDTDFSTDFSTSDFDMPDFDMPAPEASSGSSEAPASSDASAEDLFSTDSFSTDTPDFGSDFEIASEPEDTASAAPAAPDLGSEPSASGDAPSSDDFSFDMPDFDMAPSDDSSSGGDFDMPSLADSAAGNDFDVSSMEMPDSGTDFDMPVPDAETSASSSDDDDLFATPSTSSDSSGGGLSLSIDSEPESGSFELPPIDDPFSMPEGDGFNPADSGFNPDEAASFEMPEAPDFGEMSEFSMDAPDLSGDTGSFDSMDNDFSIPGFSGDSDFDLIPPEIPEKKASKPQKTEEKKGRKRKQKVERETNELTEEEYETFKDSLQGYPLNLRIALQEIIVNPDFNEEAIMKVIDMVIDRSPARTVANYLEKENLVDYAIPVPANYEKRTVAEYEEYKKTFEYRLKNRIIPIAIVSVIAVLFIWLFSFLIARFVVRPVKAEMLYSEGYTLIENGLYPQSEVKFNEAVYYKPKKSWFYKYARAYSEHKQYERAGTMYERLIQNYNYEKKAGLEYARMELDELSDYAKAEEITRRYVLDHHINDAEGMLLLGDIFLDWATYSDSSKFEDARMAYADLMAIYGQNDQYLSRMMRYFIRTDQIREVLPLKSYFYPRLDNDPLEKQDLVELSGYMLDKLFGYLAPADEYLRSSIEDVRDLLEKAVLKAPDIPESTYNLGRYFVENGNKEAALAILQESLGIFDATGKRTHDRILRNINAYRLIGEIKADAQQYIDAELMYVNGIDMFTSEQKRSGLPSDENVGILYSDLADLDYFISGDLESALANYQYAVDNHNDTPSIRYKMGYINYVDGNTSEALDSFIKTITDLPAERNTLFALGNTLVMRDSSSAAQGYYEKLIDILDREKETIGILYPQVEEEDGALVDMYMKAANNLGVTLSRLAKRNSNSMYNARAMSLLTESTRAWDALTRNQVTMRRLEGTNLAAQNLKYLTVPNSTYEPEIYTSIPRVLHGEKMLSQRDFE